MCSTPAVSVSVAVTGANYIELRVNARASPNCDTLMWGQPQLCNNHKSNSTCREQCGYRYSTEGACSLDDECMWDVNSNVCRQACSFKDRETCTGDAMCEYNRS